MDFGTRLKKIRKELGIKRDELALGIGISSASIGRYERGERSPSAHTVQEMANAMNISLDYLVGNHHDIFKTKRLTQWLHILQKTDKKRRKRILYVIDILLQDALENQNTNATKQS